MRICGEKVSKCDEFVKSTGKTVFLEEWINNILYIILFASVDVPSEALGIISCVYL